MKTGKKRFKAIIFDMDGVIVDSEPIHIKAERIICKIYGIKAPFSDWDKFRGWTSIDIFTYLIKNHATDKTLDPKVLSDDKTRRYLDLAAKLKLVPGFLSFLRKARINCATIGLATSSKKIIQEFVFEKFGLEEYFDFIVTAEDIKKGKPDPEVFRKAARKSGFNPGQCLVVEDASNGVRAAKKAGCSVLAITTSETKQKLKKAGADQVIKKFNDFKYLPPVKKIDRTGSKKYAEENKKKRQDVL